MEDTIDSFNIHADVTAHFFTFGLQQNREVWVANVGPSSQNVGSVRIHTN